MAVIYDELGNPRDSTTGELIFQNSGQATPAAASTPRGTPSSRSANPTGAARTQITPRQPDPFQSNEVISLGTLIMAFVARPLASLKNTASSSSTLPKFEEVQVIFYNFNNKASLMSHCNISQFPVSTSYFAREYARLRGETVSRAVNMSVAEFMSFLAAKIVDDQMNPAYGIADLYERKDNQVQVKETVRSTFDGTMLQRMRANNIGGHSDFVMPQLTFQFDALPVARNETGQNYGTILRLHVYDQTCSANTTFRELLALSTNNFMNNFSSYPPNTEQARALLDQQGNTDQTRHDLRENWRELHQLIINQATANNLITPIIVNRETTVPNNQGVEGTDRREYYRFTGGPQRLKEYVMKNVPHIIYGAMGTTIRSANLGSQSNAALNSINMQRSLNSSPVLPNGAQIGGVPLSLYPLELTMTSIGCPLLRSRGQEVFIDFNTNTSADNIYIINGFSHKIEAGSFETTIKLIAQDGFGQYRNMIEQLNKAEKTLEEINNTANPNSAPSSTINPPTTPRRR